MKPGTTVIVNAGRYMLKHGVGSASDLGGAAGVR